MSISRGMNNKLWHISTVEYYLTIWKKNELLIYAATCKDLKNIVKWKKSDTKEYIMYDSIHMVFKEGQN